MLPIGAGYQVHALGAAGVPAVNPDVAAPGPVGDGFDRLTAWVDHIAALGCGAVLLTPVFVSSTHGYDTVDPFRIDQRLGDEDAFGRFADACHRSGMRLILDGVFNHVGRAFPPFADVLANGAASPWVDWFRIDFEGVGPDGFSYADFEGHHELVALNHRTPEVVSWAIDVMRFWLDRGADGWRLDAAYAMPPAFVRQLVEALGPSRAEVLVFGEMIHGDYARFVAETGLDGVTQYELHKAVWSSLNDGNFFELSWALERHQEFASSFVPMTFVGNHDVTRIASQLRDSRHLPLALAVLFTVPGLPWVYYGDEFGWRGVKEHRPGGDDAIRPPLPAAPADEADGGDVLALHRQLIALRKPWVGSAVIRTLVVENRRIEYEVSGHEQALFVGLDVDGAPLPVPAGWHEVVSRPGLVVASAPPG